MNLAKANGFTVTPGAPLYWDPSKRPWSLSGAIEHNDKAGIIGMTSVPGTTNWGPRAELWARLARVSNEYAAKIRADYPRFFGMWATLPMRDYPYWSAIDTAEGLKNCGALTTARAASSFGIVETGKFPLLDAAE